MKRKKRKGTGRLSKVTKTVKIKGRKKKDSHHSFLALLYPEATPMKRGET